MHYAKVAGTGYKGGLKEAPRKGGFYCGKLTHDDTWYRVLVTEVYPAQEEAYHKAGSGEDDDDDDDGSEGDDDSGGGGDKRDWIT